MRSCSRSPVMPSRFPAFLGAVLAGLLIAEAEGSGLLGFSTIESGQYLVIGRERVNGNMDVATSNFELGANKAPVPSSSSFLSGGSSGGPGLLGNVPNIPLNARPVGTGIGGHGNIAVTDVFGTFGLSDVGIYADPHIGIRVANGQSSNQSSNSFFNPPTHFPNTFTSTGFTNPGVNNNTGGFGTDVNPNDPGHQSVRIDPPGNGGFNAGITFGYDHSPLLAELAAARTAINAFSATGVLDTGGDGKITSDTTFTAAIGLNVIDIDTGNNDFLIENSNFVIDGPAGAIVIFRLRGNDNMLISNGNVLIGNSGIGENSVLFYTDQSENDTHFGFNNTVIHGVAFWSLGPNGGKIDINNAQGCTQLVADIVDMDDVRFNYCGFLPEPSTLALMLLGAAGVVCRRRPA